MAIPQNAVGTAVNTDGTRGVVTTKVVNSVTGTKTLKVTLTNADDEDKEDIVIAPGVWAVGGAAALPEGVTLTAKDFASRDSFLAYIAHISTTIAGVRIQTDDVANLDGFLKFTQKDPSGAERSVEFDLGRFRQPLGTGYAETMRIPEAELNFLLWPGVRIEISGLKKESKIDFYFNVKGMSKAVDLSPLEAAFI